jgi:hypothetical protein
MERIDYDLLFRWFVGLGIDKAVWNHSETHESTTDPDSRLYRMGFGKEAKLSFMGHPLTENRNGLIVGAAVTEAGTRKEWEAAAELLSEQPIRPGQTVGADKGYDVGPFVGPCRNMAITPHVVARNKGSRIDGRTIRHQGDQVSQRKRKSVEQPFGWMKTYGPLKKLRHRRQDSVDCRFKLKTGALYSPRDRRQCRVRLALSICLGDRNCLVNDEQLHNRRFSTGCYTRDALNS